MADSGDRNVWARIQEHDRDKDSAALRVKYLKMQKDPFAFFRGTCPLFVEDWPIEPSLNSAPHVWVCGDLHLQNFGSYRAADGGLYYDINDFDETALAPAIFDLARMTVSVLVAFQEKQLEAGELATAFLDAYAETLAAKDTRPVPISEAEAGTDEEMQLLQGIERKTHEKLIAKQTKNGEIFDGKDYAELRLPPSQEICQILTSLGGLAGPYGLVNVQSRLGGLGSLGFPRYALLVRDSRGDTRIFELKTARASALVPKLASRQEAYGSEASRVVTAMYASVGRPPRWLMSERLDGKSFLLTEMHEDEARVDYMALTQTQRLTLLRLMGRVCAAAHLRSRQRCLPLGADEVLKIWGAAKSWKTDVLAFANSYVGRVLEDYAQFKLLQF